VGARGSGYPTGAAAAGHGAIRITNLGTVKRSDGAHLFLNSAGASRRRVEMFPAPRSCSNRSWPSRKARYGNSSFMARKIHPSASYICNVDRIRHFA
jgi:hypothetical protein